MHELYRETRAKTRFLESRGHVVIEMWEHEFLEQEKVARPLIYPEFEHHKPMDVRTAMHGGRCGPLVLYRKAEPDEKIHYVDFTSLYPFCQTHEYPYGHPKVMTYFEGQNPEDVVRESFGFVKCMVLPPTDLLFPVLPVKVRSKLMFPLCVPCAENEIRECDHSDLERCHVGTWSTLELHLAQEMGYRIIEIYEVWQYEERGKDLFRSFVMYCMKDKQEASGWPDHVTTEEERQNYLEEYERKTGIRLDPENIAKNSPRRTVAKLVANSLWGKMGEKPHSKATKFFVKPDEFYNCITNNENDVREIYLITDEVVMVQYQKMTEFVQENPKRSIVVAAWTTAWARTLLYRECRKLDPTQILYTDTDSILYSQKPGQATLSLGDSLGELTSELKPGDHITEFVAVAPKAYAYHTLLGDGACKFKGIRTNYTTQGVVNLESMLEMVEREDHVVNVPNPQITRDRKTFELKTVLDSEKIARLRFDKRVRHGHTSVPFGYKSPA